MLNSESAKLLRLEDNFRNLVMQSPVAIILLRGPDYIMELANDRALAFLHMRPEELISKPLFEALPQLAGQGLERIFKDVLKTGIPFSAQEMPLLFAGHPVHERAYINFTIQCVRNINGDITGLAAIGSDVTETVLARNELHESEVKYHGIFHSINQGFAIIDVIFDNHNKPIDYRYIEVNHAFEIQTGFENVTGKTAREVMPGLEEYWFQTYGKVALTGENITFIEESRFLGGVYEVFAYRIDNNHRVAVLFTDISSRIKEEEAKNRFAEELKTLVAERTEELESSNRDLQQFAHVASHDLKEPVRKIKTFTTMLEDEFSDLLPDRGKEFIRKIQNSIDRIKNMIDGVLSYSSHDTPQITEIDLNDIFKSIIIDLEILIENKNAKLRLSNLPKIEGSATLIYQLFYNLINNSLKFSRAGVPSVITINSTLNKEEHENFVKITITDNGVGFNPNQSSIIFEPFTRLYSKDKYEGTGLGLALCKKIVQWHKGSISASGNANEGATFYIVLPVKQERLK